jgi:hypothetical protein
MMRGRLSARAWLLTGSFLFTGAGCHDGVTPTVVSLLATPTATPAAVAVEAENLAPRASFRISPGPDGRGIVQADRPAAHLVRFDMCPTADPEGDRLIFSFDFVGDGSQTHAGSTGSDCRQDHLYVTGAGVSTVRAEQCVVDVDADGNLRHEPQCQSYTVRISACGTGGACTVFAVSAPTGALGGLDGADDLCQTTADTYGVPSGRYRAWLSDSTGSPATRFRRSSGPYVRLDGEVVANDWADLTDGSLLTGPGQLPYGPRGYLIVSDPVWTNTLPDGQSAGGPSCQDWQSALPADMGLTGVSVTFPMGPSWTYFTPPSAAHCDNAISKLYCFQQD